MSKMDPYALVRQPDSDYWRGVRDAYDPIGLGMRLASAALSGMDRGLSLPCRRCGLSNCRCEGSAGDGGVLGMNLSGIGARLRLNPRQQALLDEVAEGIDWVLSYKLEQETAPVESLVKLVERLDKVGTKKMTRADKERLTGLIKDFEDSLWAGQKVLLDQLLADQ